jgi:hypothetical protein
MPHICNSNNIDNELQQFARNLSNDPLKQENMPREMRDFGRSNGNPMSNQLLSVPEGLFKGLDNLETM